MGKILYRIGTKVVNTVKGSWYSSDATYSVGLRGIVVGFRGWFTRGGKSERLMTISWSNGSVTRRNHTEVQLQSEYQEPPPKKAWYDVTGWFGKRRRLSHIRRASRL